MVTVVIRPALVVALIVALGCQRWRPLAIAELPREARDLRLRVLRVETDTRTREVRVHRVQGAVVEAWEPSTAQELRLDLATARRVWVREAHESLNAWIVGGTYALVFAVSCLGFALERR